MSDFRLLPGPVNVFLDDSYVSKTWIQVSSFALSLLMSV